MANLDEISKTERAQRIKDLLLICLILVLGVLLGILAKFLDNISRDNLPVILQQMRLDRLLSRMPIWLFLALIISLYSRTPLKASISVFLFFSGLIGSYYWYSATILGVYSISKVSYWLFFTLVSPVLAYICWYLKLKNYFSRFLLISIISVLAYYVFIDGLVTFGHIFLWDLLILLATFIMIKRIQK